MGCSLLLTSMFVLFLLQPLSLASTGLCTLKSNSISNALPIDPMGLLLTRCSRLSYPVRHLFFLTACTECTLQSNSNAPPHRPDGVLAFSHGGCLSQGGGVWIINGDLTFTNCEIYSNQATSVSAQNPIAPMGCSLFTIALAAHREVASLSTVAT